MMNIVAKPIVKNKYWIVEQEGTKIATIQAIDEGGFVYVHDERREKFATIKMLTKKYSIEFAKADKPKIDTTIGHEVYGFPTTHKPYNQVLDVQRYLPIYTKSLKSKSFFCAGYYLVKLNHNWTRTFCPKLITLQRYDFLGPFATEQEQNESLRKQNGK